MYAPKGTGALYVRQGINIQSCIDGGSQENNLRAGTENVPGIVGLGKAMEETDLNLYNYSNRLMYLRDNFIKGIEEQIPGVVINGDRKYRLPGNVNVSLKRVNARSVIEELSNRNICVSGGSACSAKNQKPSHVLTAIGLSPNIANSTIRITFGRENDMEDVIYTINQIKDILEGAR